MALMCFIVVPGCFGFCICPAALAMLQPVSCFQFLCQRGSEKNIIKNMDLKSWSQSVVQTFFSVDWITGKGKY